MTRWTKWLIIIGQMAHITPRGELNDVDRFRLFLRRGSPGPYAYVVLLGLRIFDGPALLREMDQVGMLLDVTHLADQSFWEAFR